MEVGDIVIVDGGSIGRVTKKSDESAIVICLEFPFFRTIIKTDWSSCVTVAKGNKELIKRLVSGDKKINAATFEARWKREIDSLARDVVDEFWEDYNFDDYDEDDLDIEDDEVLLDINRKAKKVCKDCEFLADIENQQNAVAYCIHYLDISPKDFDIPEAKRNDWKVVLSHSAVAHLSKDVAHRAISILSKRKKSIR